MPAPTDRVLSALRIADPARWRATVRAALRAEGTIPGAAASLGVARGTLFRWIAADPAEVVDDLVAEDADEPGPFAGTAGERAARP